MSSAAPTGRVPRVSPASLIAIALVANLLIASTVALAIAPVATTGAILEGYDGLPDGLGALLGDGPGRAATDGRGPIGTWLAGLYASALAASPRAQLAVSLELTADVPVEEWVPATAVNLTWRNYGAPLTYRAVATTTDEPPAAIPSGGIETTTPAARVPIPSGTSWVHVQAWHNGKSGPVTTIGPFRSDPEPPPAPVIVGAPGRTVKDYHFPITWQSVDAPSGIAAYVVERLHPTGWQNIARVDGDTTTHLERNRPNGEYTYRVRAESRAGLLTSAAATATTQIIVDAQASLVQPSPGTWYRGFNTVYDSLLYTYDIHDPSIYSNVPAIANGNAGLTTAQYEMYTGTGWGIEIDDPGLREIVADTLGGTLQPNGDITGGEQNALRIGLLLFEWLFNATDYDFARLEGGNFDLMRATETLAAGGGVCGDLTALYVTMMRIAGVPARPVHGYLINQGSTTGQNFARIGGFHMWAEIYVGGDAREGPGGGWIPVDVSGVTGTFESKFLHMYFGVANPNYLQLGVQDDLGDEALGDDHKRNRWNVWANLEWSWFGGGGSTEPDVQFTADARLEELESETGRIWFTPATGERVYCAGTANSPCQGEHRFYYDNVRGRSLRTMDYGAAITWSGNVHELKLTLRYPSETAPTQVAMWTTYAQGGGCTAQTTTPTSGGNPQWGGLAGTVEWTIPGDSTQCPA